MDLKALHFSNGSSINFEDIFSMGTRDFNIAAWFQFGASSTGGNVLIAKSNYTSGYSKYVFRIPAQKLSVVHY